MKLFIFILGLAGFLILAFSSRVYAGSDTNALEELNMSELRSLEPVPFADSNGTDRKSALALYDAIREAKVKTAFKDYNGAMAVMGKIVNSYPHFATAYAYRALLEHDLGYDDDAFADCAKAIKLNPRAPYPYYARGVLEIESFRDYTNGLSDFNTIRHLDPENVLGYRAGAWAERMLKNYTNAFEDLSEAIKLESLHFTNPRPGDSYAALGWLQNDLGQYQQALQSFQTALARSSGQEKTWLRIWVLRSRLGDRENATHDLAERLHSLSKARLELWPATCGRFLIGQTNEPDLIRVAGDFATGTRLRKEALCSANYYIGMKQLLDGNKARALTFLRKAMAMNVPGYSEYESAAAELDHSLNGLPVFGQDIISSSHTTPPASSTAAR
jgi:tetratricopeptide (TPR) repeat protein